MCKVTFFLLIQDSKREYIVITHMQVSKETYKSHSLETPKPVIGTFGYWVNAGVLLHVYSLNDMYIQVGGLYANSREMHRLLRHVRGQIHT